MAKIINDARSMFSDVSTSLLSEEENSSTQNNTGFSARENLGLSKYPVRNIVITDITKNSDIQFRAHPFNPKDYQNDEALFSSMGDPNIGLLEPIMVQEIVGIGTDSGLFGQGKKYQVVFGHRRLSAAKMLGWEKIQAHVAKAGEDISHFTFVENDSGEPQTPYERSMILRNYCDLHPSQKLAELASKFGRSSSYLYKLLSVTDNDTPVPLIDLFAQGMSMNKFIALKPVFIAANKDNHIKMAKTLANCSTSTAQKISEAVDQGVDPLTAMEMYCGFPIEETSEKLFPNEKKHEEYATAVLALPVEAPLKVISKSNSIKNPLTPKTAKPAPESNSTGGPSKKLPSGVIAFKDEVIEKMAKENGTSKVIVRALIKIAITEDMEYQELEDACLISAVCEDATKAVWYLTLIMSDSRAFSAFKQYARAVRLVLKTLYKRESEHAFQISTALREGVFSPLPLSPDKPVKKGK